MREMSERNKEMLAAVLSGASKPKDVAKAYGVDINKVYKLTHNHREKLKRAEARAKRLREADKRKKEAKAQSHLRRRGWWEKLQVEREKEALKAAQRQNKDELQKIAIAARKLHAITISPPAPSTKPEDYFERLEMAQAEIDRLVAESTEQKRQIELLQSQNKMFMKMLSKYI